MTAPPTARTIEASASSTANASREVTLRPWTRKDASRALLKANSSANGPADDWPTWMLAALNAASPHGCPVVTREGEGS